MRTTEDECIEALQRAAERLDESPTKSQYEELDLTPSSTTILRVVGGWNKAKELADLDTYTQKEGGGIPVQPKPEGVELPPDREWTELTAQQRWYCKNREHRIECKEERRRNLQEWLTAFKREHCTCERCGETDPPCLDFHHVDEKATGISRMANYGYSRKRIREEMEACTVLCANCHRKEHYGSQEEVQMDTAGDSAEEADTGDHVSERHRRRAWLDRYKLENGGCVRCNESDPVCLDFHHIGSKTMEIAEMVSRRRPVDQIRDELEKCELLCANCHRKEHHDR